MQTKGNITLSAQLLGISRQALHKRIFDNEDLKEFHKEMMAENIEYVEDKLFKLIKQNNPAAIMFYLKCKGGYREKQEISHKNGDKTSDNVLVVPEIKEKKKWSDESKKHFDKMKKTIKDEEEKRKIKC